AHLPHEPLDGAIALLARLREKFSGLVGEVDQDRAGLHQPQPVLAVHDRGNAVVGRDLEEGGRELLVLADVDGMRGVGQAHLLEGDRDLAAVRCGPGVEVDHKVTPWVRSCFRSMYRRAIIAAAWPSALRSPEG